MSIVAVGTVRSCGATTLALGLAATWPSHRRVLLIEADPAGGTIAAAAGFPAEPSLVSLAAAVRRSEAVELAVAHTHALPGGAPVLTAPATAEQSERALALLTSLFGNLGKLELDVVLDCGRLSSFAVATTERPSEASPPTNTDRFLAADVSTIVTRPQLADLHALGGFLDHPRFATARHDGRLRLAVVGTGPYADDEIAQVLGAPVVAHLPFESDPAMALATVSANARELRRTSLVRELRSLATLFAPEANESEHRVPDSDDHRARGWRRYRQISKVETRPIEPEANGDAHTNGTSVVSQ